MGFVGGSLFAIRYLATKIGGGYNGLIASKLPPTAGRQTGDAGWQPFIAGSALLQVQARHIKPLSAIDSGSPSPMIR